MSKRTISGVAVEEVEKRRHPSKHYVYVIFVTWSDGVINVVFRRYSKFFDLQVRLLDKFPKDAGYFDPQSRCIPFLPGKILLGRSHIREVALKRLKPIDAYCKKLIKLEPHISESLDVLDFFESKPDDFQDLERRTSAKDSSAKGAGSSTDNELKHISNPRLLEQYTVVEDYKKVGKSEVSLTRGDVVEVVEKNKTGWWFISTDESQGWAPSSHLMPNSGDRDSLIYQQANEGQGDYFIVHRSYTAQAKDELSLDKGKIVEVLEQTLDGWWLVKDKNTRGRFPSTNLARADTLRAQGLNSRTPVRDVEIVGSLKDVTGSIGNRKETAFSSPAASSSNLRPDWESVVKKASPLPEAKKRPAPRSTPQKPERPPLPSPSKIPQSYITVEDFDSSTVGDGISFRKGQTVKVLEKTDQGWWFVDIEGQEGWAPSAYLEVKKGGPPLPAAPPKAEIKSTPDVVRPKWPISSSSRNDHQEAESRTPQPTPVKVLPSLPQAVTPTASNDSEMYSTIDHSESEIYENVANIQEESVQPIHNNDQQNSETKFVALHDYKGEDAGELTFSGGQIVTLVAEYDRGWWHVRLDSGDEGYAPSTYFGPIEDKPKGLPQLPKSANNFSNHGNPSSASLSHGDHGNSPSNRQQSDGNYDNAIPVLASKLNSTATKPAVVANKPKPTPAAKPTVAAKPALKAKPFSNGQVPVLPKKPLQPSNKQHASNQNQGPAKSSKISQMAKMFE